MPESKIVRLLEPNLCLGCRFHGAAEVTTPTGTRHMMFCKRLDCDNWQVETDSEQVLRLEQEHPV